MLLRGVVFPPPALNEHDIETTKGKAARSGRQHGGVPLSGDGRGRNGFNYASDNRGYSSHNDQRDRGLGSGYKNPFPAPPPGWQPPAPGSRGFAQGPPPAYGSYDRNQGPRGYGNDNRRGAGDSYRGNGGGYRGGRGGGHY